MLRALVPLALACSLVWLGCPAAELDLQETRRLQEANRAEETIDPLREALAEDPENREVSLLLGSALAQSHRFGEAMFHLRRAARDGPFVDEAGLLLGATLLSIENHEAAIEAVDAVLARDPSALMGWLIRGQAALLSAQPELALESAVRARQAQPDDFSARIVEAGALVALDRNDEAERVIHELFEAAPEIGPDAVATACTEYARFQVTLGSDAAGARATLDSCSDVLITNPLWVEAGAQLYARAGDSDAAMALVRRALEETPEQHSLRILVSKELRLQGDTRGAEEELLAGTTQPRPSQLWAELSTLRREEGDLAGSLDAIDQALSGAGDTEALRFARADLLVDLGRLSDARAEVGRLEEPIYRDIVNGRIELERGEPERAMALLQSALQQWPDHAGVRILAARAAYEIGDEERALTDLLEATRAAPSDTDASLLLARLHLLRGENDEAYLFARRHLEHRGAGEPEALLVAARAARASGDLKGATAALETLAAQPAHSALGVSELAAYVAEIEGVAAGRKVIADAALDLGAIENDVVLRRAVRLEIDDDKPEAAVRLLDEVLAADPENVSALAIRAHVHSQRGDVDAARADFEAALSLQRDHAESQAGLGALEFAAGNGPATISRYQHAVDLEPKEPGYRYGLAQALLASDSAAAAEEELRIVLRTHPEHAAAANDLAWLLALRSDSLDLALRLAERAVRITPSAATRDTLGLVHLRSGRIDAARTAFHAALEERPEYSTARYHLALTDLELGKPGEARRAIELALAGEPFAEESEARAALVRLGE